jgi:hypothetical protein
LQYDLYTSAGALRAPAVHHATGDAAVSRQPAAVAVGTHRYDLIADMLYSVVLAAYVYFR